MEKKENNNGLNIDISNDVVGGVYSNLAIITHSQQEFLVDFAQIMPGLAKPRVASRVIMTPVNAKRLLKALSDNVAKFESENGPIDLGGPSTPPIIPPMGFSGEA